MDEGILMIDIDNPLIIKIRHPMDEEGEPRSPTSKDFKKYDKKKIEKVIVGKTKKKKHIIHGARAVNKQVSKKFRRKTGDYDLWAGWAESQMDQLEDELDAAVGCDMFYERVLTMPDSLTGRNKEVFQVVSRKTDESVADYTHRPGGASYVKIGGLRYETLKHAKKTKKAILRDARWNPMLTQKRIDKTRRDLNRILAFERSKKKKSKKRKK